MSACSYASICGWRQLIFWLGVDEFDPFGRKRSQTKLLEGSNTSARGDLQDLMSFREELLKSSERAALHRSVRWCVRAPAAV